MNTEFLSQIKAYRKPIGSHHDPVGKEGLAALVSEILGQKTSKFKDSYSLFSELENLGADFGTSVSLSGIDIHISAPRSRDGVREILDEIVLNSAIDSDILQRIVDAQKMSIDELASNDKAYATHKLQLALLRERDVLGTKESLDAIDVADIDGFLKSMSQGLSYIEVGGPEKYEVSGDLEIGEMADQDTEHRDIIYLDRDIEQKVIGYGHRVGGFGDYNYATRKVLSAILYSGLVGFVGEKIREEHSAAYYAQYFDNILPHKGMVYMVAGVSDSNVAKALEIMVSIEKDMISGNIEAFRLDMAKNYFKGALARHFDSLYSTYSLITAFAMNGLEMSSYAQLCEQIDKVTMDEVVELAKLLFSGNPTSVVLNGHYDNLDRLKEIVQDV